MVRGSVVGMGWPFGRGKKWNKVMGDEESGVGNKSLGWMLNGGESGCGGLDMMKKSLFSTL